VRQRLGSGEEVCEKEIKVGEETCETEIRKNKGGL
jgi:hypothetical protein